MKCSIRMYSQRALAVAICISTVAVQASVAQSANDGIRGVGVGLGHRPNPSANVVYKTTTNATGGFTFSNVAPGEYELVVLPPTPTHPTNPAAPVNGFNKNLTGPDTVKVAGQSTAVNTSRSNVKNNSPVDSLTKSAKPIPGAVIAAPGHVSFAPAKGVTIVNGVGVKSATGPISLSMTSPVTVTVTSSGTTISGTISN